MKLFRLFSRKPDTGFEFVTDDCFFQDAVCVVCGLRKPNVDPIIGKCYDCYWNEQKNVFGNE